MVYQNLPHGSGTNAKEVCAVLPADLASVHQSQIGFIHQCCGLQGVIGALGGHHSAGHLAQFTIDQGCQPIEGFLASTAPGSEQYRDLVG